MSTKWIKLDKASGLVTKLVDNVADGLAELLIKAEKAPQDLSKADVADLKKRQMGSVGTRTTYRVEQGEQFANARKKPVADLTAAMLAE